MDSLLVVSGEAEAWLLEVPDHGRHLGEDARLLTPHPNIITLLQMK